MTHYSIKTAGVINNSQSRFFGYGEDLNTIKRLMNKDKLGIMSEQLFKILINKYPAEYRLLLIEKEYKNTMIEK